MRTTLLFPLLISFLLAACQSDSSDEALPVSASALEVVVEGENLVAGGSRQTLRAGPDPEDGSVSWTWRTLPGSLEPLAVEMDANRFTYTAPDVVAPESLQIEALRNSGESGTVLVRIHPQDASDQQPEVLAGDDISADEAEALTLIGRATAQGERTIRRLKWEQVAGPAAEFIGASDRDRLELQLPHIAEPSELRLRLTATDSGGFKASDDVIIQLRNNLPNQLPQVNAGAPYSVLGRETGQLAAIVDDPDGSVASGEWTVEAPHDDLPLTVDPVDFRRASFLAPNVGVSREITFRFKAVDNEGASGADTVVVTINPGANAAPTIDRADADPTLAYGGDRVDLVGEASDADNDPLFLKWVQQDTGAPAVAIRDPESTVADLILPNLSAPADFAFELRADDGRETALSNRVSLQGYPRDEPEPDPVACVLNPLQKGCPLYPAAPLLDPAAFALCANGPLTPGCPFAELASADPGVFNCLSDPSAERCTQVLTNISDPGYVLEALGPDERADACNPAFAANDYEHYVGALHEHTAYSDGTFLTRPADVYARAKDMGLDFVGSSDHSDTLGLPLSVGRGDCASEDALYCYLVADDDRQLDAFRKWLATGEQAEEASDEHFTAFRGYEWTSDRFGHANVYFSRNFINAKTGPGYAVGMARFWEWFAYPAQFGGGADGLLSFNHPGREDAVEDVLQELGLGDPAYTFNDFRHVAAADYRTVGIEVFGKGSKYEYGGPLNKNGTGSWYSYALDKGWHLGPVGSEDHHGTDWGDPDLPKTVFIARSVAADDLREAMLARRFYSVAQDYNDVRLEFSAGGHPMGSRLRAPSGTEYSLTVSVSRNGAPLTSAVIELVSEANSVVARATGGSMTYTLSVGDSKRYYFVRVLNAADSSTQIAFSAPVWLIPGNGSLPACEPLPLLDLQPPLLPLP